MDRFQTLPWTPLYSQVPYEDDDTSDNDSSSSSWFTLYAMVGTIAFTTVVHMMEGYLDLRQKRAYQQTKFPMELQTIVTVIDTEKQQQQQQQEEESSSQTNNHHPTKDTTTKPLLLLPQLQSKFIKAQHYGTDKIQFAIVSNTYETCESLVYLMVGVFPYLWHMACTYGSRWFGTTTPNEQEIPISLIFLALLTILGTITSLPFELYSTFQIERKHGFNKQTIGLFVSDKLKGLVLTFVIGGPFMALLLKIIKSGGEYFYLYVWGFVFVFSVFMMTIYPVVIMPLFNKYEPLEDGDLKTRIYDLAAQLNYPLTKLFVMDGSKRSAHSNAFMFGFGNNKRIVLFDTLLEQVHDDEILAILGHELGHWKLGHTLINFVVTQVYFGAAFYFFSLTYGSQDLYAAFGFNDPTNPAPTIVALMLFFQTLWAPVDKILSFVLTVFSRKNEFAADRFSVDLGMSRKLQSGLCKIHLENLGAMCPDPWYSTYHYSHPPLVERLSAMMELEKKQK